MTVNDITTLKEFTTLVEADLSREIASLYCCDLLSIAMSKAKSDCAWVTVMGNINAVAVASLVDISCIVLAEGSNADANMLEKAKVQNINVLKTDLPIFEAAMLIEGKRNA